MGQKPDQGDVGAAGRGIFGDAERRREHARLDLHAVLLGRDMEMVSDVLGPRPALCVAKPTFTQPSALPN